MGSDPSNPTSLFDRIAFTARLFHPGDHDTLAPPDARDLMIQVDPACSIHLRLHTSPAAIATILLFHGNGEVVADYDGFAAWYRNAGASLAVAEYRGYGRCDGTPFLRTCLHDARAVARALQGTLDRGKRPLIVMGRSLGSFCALEVAARDPLLIDGLVIESGIGDLDTFVARRGFDPGLVTAQDRIDFCPLQKADRVRAPTLLLHGAADDIVPPDNARLLLQACGAKDKQLVMVPERGHNDVFLGDPYWPTLAGFVRNVTDTVARPRGT